MELIARRGTTLISVPCYILYWGLASGSGPISSSVIHSFSLNLGEITMHHDILSRIKAFNKIMRIVIIADCSRCISNRSEVDFGASKPRDPSTSV